MNRPQSGTRRRVMGMAALAASILVAGSTATACSLSASGPSTPTTTSTVPAPTSTVPAPTSTVPAPTSTVPAPAGTTGGWEVTVYVTAVEQYYSGPTKDVLGCTTIACGPTNDTSDLGSYPTSFVNRVMSEGTGRITSGPHAGMYLNWSAGISTSGLWLDTAPRDSFGGVLVPFVSAASDGIPRGSQVKIVGCGTNSDGTPVDPTVCTHFTTSGWQIQDQFTPGLGGANHIDLYLGDENQANFENTSSYWITFEHALVSY